MPDEDSGLGIGAEYEKAMQLLRKVDAALIPPGD